jgi:hypothetical protein
VTETGNLAGVRGRGPLLDGASTLQPRELSMLPAQRRRKACARPDDSRRRFPQNRAGFLKKIIELRRALATTDDEMTVALLMMAIESFESERAVLVQAANINDTGDAE